MDENELRVKCPTCWQPSNYAMCSSGKLLVLHVGCGWHEVALEPGYHPSTDEMRVFLVGQASKMPFEVTARVWNYFLEVLPPSWMNEKRLIAGRVQRCDFGFAEGWEPVTAFWREWEGPPGDRRVVRWWACLLNEMNRNRW